MPAAVDFLCNPITKTVVDDVWAQAARAEGYTRVRAAITCDAYGKVPWGLVATGAAAWKRAGVDVDGYTITCVSNVGGVVLEPIFSPSSRGPIGNTL